MEALDREIQEGVHALAIEVLPPDGPFEVTREIKDL
jgi:hypothetical protein